MMNGVLQLKALADLFQVHTESFFGARPASTDPGYEFVPSMSCRALEPAAGQALARRWPGAGGDAPRAGPTHARCVLATWVARTRSECLEAISEAERRPRSMHLYFLEHFTADAGGGASGQVDADGTPAPGKPRRTSIRSRSPP